MAALSFSSVSFVKILSIKLLERSPIVVGRVMIGTDPLVTSFIKEIVEVICGTLTTQSIHVLSLQAPQHPKNPTIKMRQPRMMIAIDAVCNCSDDPVISRTSSRSLVCGSTFT